ncbi:MAG: restriction endonuclease subunit S [Pseudomonadota bacterium]
MSSSLVDIPKYYAYKDSGVEWLGDIPEQWEVSCSKWLFSQRKERARKDDEQLTASQRYGVISQKTFMELEGRRVTQVFLNSEILKHVEAGDFVISMRSFQGGIEFCPYKGSVSSAYVPLVPSDSIQPRFFKYLLKCQRYIEALQSTSNLVRDGQALRYENFTMVDLPVLPLEEQSSIAAYLDRKTSQIDQAVEIKEQQIVLLKERKKIFIQNAVTRGLNPDAPMRDSGVEWIGEIPAHWQVRRSKFVFGQRKELAWKDDVQLSATQAYGVIPQELYEEKTGYRVVKIQLHLEKRKHVEVDDFVISMRSFQGGLERAWSRGCIRSSYVVLRPMLEVDAGYFGRLFKSPRYISALQATGNFIRDGQDLNFENYSLVDLVLPPLSEQMTIAEWIDTESTKIDKAIELQQHQIDKLKEYKATLINSAVTGKIKVA